MDAAQWHAGHDAQAYSGRRGVDDTPRLVGSPSACADDEGLSTEGGVEHFLEYTVEVANTDMHGALSQACAFSCACGSLHGNGLLRYAQCRAIWVIFLHGDFLRSE